VESEIGRGGMGIVFRAYDQDLRRSVALKVLRIGRDDEKAVERFIRESRAAGMLRHDHIVPILDVTRTDDGRPVLVMPFILGPSLRETIQKQGRFTPQDAATLIRNVADGLDAVHRAGLVHRDVKPGNILIDRVDGRAKLTDFGLARLQTTGETLTDDGSVAGTPEYLSPEQARNASRADARSDVYSLGITLYECLTGVVPFRGSVFEVISRHNDETPVPIRQLVSCPTDLETITLTCLLKQPHRRYQSAAELRDDLDRWREGRPIQARPVGTVERTLRWARRNPWPVALLVTAIIGCLVSAVGWRQAYINSQRAMNRENDAQNALALANERATIALDSVNTLIKTSRNVIAEPAVALKWKKELNEAAIAELQRLAKVLRDLPGAENAAMQAHQKIGDSFFILGQNDEAEHHWNRVIAIGDARLADHPDDPVTARELAKGLVAFGNVKNRKADYPGAAAFFDRAISALAFVHKRFPDNVLVEDSLGFSWGHRGEVWLNQGKPHEAIDCFTKASHHVRQALARQPNDVFIQSNAHAMLSRLASCRLSLLYDSAGAEADFRELLTLANQHLERDPKNTIWQRNKSITHLELASALQIQGQYKESEQEVLKAMKPLADIAEVDPDHRLKQSDLASAWKCLGEAQIGAMQFEDAESSFAKSNAILDRFLVKGSRGPYSNLYIRNFQGGFNAAVRAGHFVKADELLGALDQYVVDELSAGFSKEILDQNRKQIESSRQAIRLFPAAIDDPKLGQEQPDDVIANVIWIRTVLRVQRNDLDQAEADLRTNSLRNPDHYFVHIATATIHAAFANRDPRQRESQLRSGSQSLIKALRLQPGLMAILNMAPELDAIRFGKDFQSYLKGLNPR
jgi:tetratricopeptide (TPR) repeat protein